MFPFIGNGILSSHTRKSEILVHLWLPSIYLFPHPVGYKVFLEKQLLNLSILYNLSAIVVLRAKSSLS